jgi:signal transduction histidine kinase
MPAPNRRRNPQLAGGALMSKHLLKFRVDSALLDELGQRLVGKPSIALAEMIKNSYDADATEVQVEVEPSGKGSIVVSDNGHGMTFEEFQEFWMSVGTTHKLKQGVSRKLKRPLTGSKGVGRIAARLLARKIEIETVGEPKRGQARQVLKAELDWDTAQKAEKELTQVSVPVTTTAAADKGTYTKIRLTGLRSDWPVSQLKELARETWFLQPPFDLGEGKKTAFRIDLRSKDDNLTAAFQEQVQAIKAIWNGRIRGRIEGGKNKVSLEFRGGDHFTHSFPVDPWHQALEGVDYEILVYHFKGRQPMGLSVGEARKYLEDFSGIHIFDRGFRLPYYGEYSSDWLGLVEDQARSLTNSKLLPESLQIDRGLLHLPPLKNVIGAVHIQSETDSGLEVTIQRDRLKDTPTFEALAKAVRTSLDWYAQEQAKQLFQRVEVLKEKGDVRQSVVQAEEVLAKHADKIPQPIFAELKTTMQRTARASAALMEKTTTQVAALGSLATAGISALAFQHEFLKQIKAIQSIVRRLEEAGKKPSPAEIHRISTDLSAWVSRVESLFSLLGHLREAEHVTVEKAYSARMVVEETWAQIQGLVPGVEMANQVPQGIHLPKATYAEWASVLQNAFYNALNAMLDEPDKRIAVGVKEDKDGTLRLHISDSGCGVDLEDAEGLFKPFVRKMRTTQERAGLRLGGTGLGLSIVRMIVEHRKGEVRFVPPEPSYATTLEISWR